LKEVKFNLCSRELRLKASGNGDEASTFKLLVTNSAKQKKKKGKDGKKRKIDSKEICNYCKELGHWKQDCPKKAKKNYVVALV